MKDSNYLKERNAKSISDAEGTRISDVDGHQVVDAVGGLWNVNLGYSCAPVKAAISNQLDRLPYYSIFRGTSNDCVIELGDMLQDFFLRLARQYHKIKGQDARTKYLSLKKGYHGTHFGGASVNGNANFRTAYEPLMPGCFHIPAPYTYRNPFNETDPERLAQLCLQALEDEIAFQGANTIAALIMEPILGAGGVIPPHESFMPGVRKLCDDHGILLIADEVITAFGRTGSWTGSRHWGVKPDFMCTAKAITNGYFPFGALMIADHVVAVFEGDTEGKAAIGHGYTYSGHPVGAAAAIACINETLRLNVKDNAAVRGQQLFEGLQKLYDDFDVIGDVRGGHGLMCALELVSDRETKKPIDKATPVKLQKAAYESGAMIRVSGPNVILSPPLIVTSQDVDTILAALRSGFQSL